MLRYSARALIVVSSFFVLSCADTAVVQTGSIEVQWDVDKIDVFEAAQTFSVVTSDLVDPPDLDEDQMVFNDTVNRLIIEAMQAEPVCLELVPADEAEANPPDLWAANGIARTTEGGYYYQCVGGWVWGFFGWYWDSCAYWRPTYVEWDVGSMLIPVLPPPTEGEEPEPIFNGLAQSVVGTGTDVETTARAAVQAIFAQWPDQRTCSPQ
ncbi:MAG: hypothetical protein JRD92_10060 [Deltaproteobacteria bacterium]|jgi:hypothetical protein|nr:hypothetical protein [Deltaproteobacteria bacterium]MBW2160539.1 hypothetical protein [Deltaproteobacteria bacterium]MBW2375519.1 hypothetical protein [Deltaproteobacteria bacterium]MBW2587273.1 hypothetical protein [Deltaproteobacteria bacterium]